MTKPYPLRYSLPALLLLFGAAVTFVSIWDGVRDSGQRARDETLRQLKSLGNNTAARLDHSYSNGMPIMAEQEFALLDQIPHLRLGMVLDGSDRVILSTDPRLKVGGLEKTPAREETRAFAEARKKSVSQIHPSTDGSALAGIFPLKLVTASGDLNPSSAGSLYLSMDLQEQKDLQITRTFQHAGMICALAFVLVVLSWLYLDRTLTKRVANLISATRAMAAGDFSQRTDLQGMDELAQLGDSFNQMAEQIQARTGSVSESEARYRRIVETAYEGIFAVDAAQHLVFANRRMAEMLGFTIDGMMGRPFSELLFEEDTSAHEAKLMRPQLGEAVRFEQKMKRKDGEEVWTIISATVRRDEAGAFEAAFGMATDITERKRAEARLQLQSSALNASANAIVITDGNGIIEWINPAFTRLTGYTSEEVIGRNPNLLKSGRHAPEFYESMWATIRAGNVWQGEMLNKRKDGTLYTEYMTIAPVRDEAGHIAHYVAIKEDVTERQKIEAQSRQAQKMEAASQLAGGVAHGFNDALTAIIGYANLLEKSSEISSTDRRMAQEISGAANRATDLTRQLLLFSRQQPMDRQPVVLNESLNQLHGQLKQLLGQKSRLHCDYAPDLPTIAADQGMIEKIVMNLAANAHAAMPAGGVLTLTTRLVTIDPQSAAAIDGARPGRFICLTVSDTGCGMNDAELRRIFEPFFNADAGNGKSGLGLATVYGIVKQHKGWVEVTSQIDQGTNFQIFLPVSDRAVAPVNGKAPVAPAGSAGSAGTILVVEDDLAVLRVTRKYLQRHGYHVLEAINSAAALEVWRNHSNSIDLLFTDILMPGDLDGRDLADLLMRERPDLKVLFSSGYSRKRVGIGQEEHSSEYYLSKPYDLKSLGHLIGTILGEAERDESVQR